jgi:hypothetical protein
MRVDIERIRKLRAELEEINAIDLKDLQLFENNQPVTIQPKTIEWWKFVGLSNMSFLESLDLTTGTIPITEVEDEEEDNG